MIRELHRRAVPAGKAWAAVLWVGAVLALTAASMGRGHMLAPGWPWDGASIGAPSESIAAKSQPGFPAGAGERPPGAGSSAGLGLLRNPVSSGDPPTLSATERSASEEAVKGKSEALAGRRLTEEQGQPDDSPRVSVRSRGETSPAGLPSSQDTVSGLPSDPQIAGEIKSLVWPASGRVRRGFGWYRDPVFLDWRFDDKVWISVKAETPVKAAMAGRVEHVELSPLVTITLDHGSGWRTTYAGLDPESVAVSAGQEVAAGGILGRSPSAGADGASSLAPGGEPGPTVGFAVNRDGKPLDPLGFVRKL